MNIGTFSPLQIQPSAVDEIYYGQRARGGYLLLIIDFLGCIYLGKEHSKAVGCGKIQNGRLLGLGIRIKYLLSITIAFLSPTSRFANPSMILLCAHPLANSGPKLPR
jgi:hypothetical protein